MEMQSSWLLRHYKIQVNIQLNVLYLIQFMFNYRNSSLSCRRDIRNTYRIHTVRNTYRFDGVLNNLDFI